MIIRKPYAFIVKHYRIIHLILLLPLIFLCIKSYNLMRFFSSFVRHGYKTDIVGLVKVYYSLLIPLFSLIMGAFCITIITLFIKKKRNYSTYLVFAIFYLLLFIISLFIPGILTNFETKDIESAIALLVSGFSGVIFYIQPLIIIMFTLNGFGFDIKNFEFNNIKDEISLDEEDSEEVEVNLGVDNYKFKRLINRYFRELKYYVIENKIYFLVGSTILGLILLFFIGKWIISLNRIVSIDQGFKHSSFSVTFNDALLSTMDYNGNNIQKGKIYLAVKTTIKNNSNTLLSLDTDAFWLQVNGKNYYPVLDRSGKFIDLAKPYYGERIGPGNEQEIVLVYEFDETYLYDRYKIKVLDSLEKKEYDVVGNYREISVKPTYSASIINKGEYNLGDTINLKDTNLLNSDIKFDKYEINKTHQYHYNYCFKEDCKDSINSVTAGANKVLLTMDGKITLDENSSYYKHKLGSNKIVQDFMAIEYSIDGKKYLTPVKDVTPSNITDNSILLETSGEIKKAETINLVITVRNLRYILKLK